MSTSPHSFRWPEKLSKLVKEFADGAEQTFSAFVQEAVEDRVMRGDFFSAVVSLFVDGEDTLSKIKEGAFGATPRPLKQAEMAALMRFWRTAYQLSSEGYATPSYVVEMLTILAEVSALLEAVPNSYGWEHALGCLGKKPSAETEPKTLFRPALEEAKARFKQSPTVKAAEMILRPMETMAEFLGNLPPAELEKIFTSERLKTLWPVAVRGAKANRDEWFVDPEEGSGMAMVAKRDMDGLSLVTYWQWLRIVVNGKHHVNVFGAKVSSDLLTGWQNGVFQKLQQESTGLYRREGLEVIRNAGQWILHEYGSYRLSLNDDEFYQLVDMVVESYQETAWRHALQQFRSISGDI